MKAHLRPDTPHHHRLYQQVCTGAIIETEDKISKKQPDKDGDTIDSLTLQPQQSSLS